MGNDGPHFLAIRRRIFDLACRDDRCLPRRKRSEKGDSRDACKHADELFHGNLPTCAGSRQRGYLVINRSPSPTFLWIGVLAPRAPPPPSGPPATGAVVLPVPASGPEGEAVGL